MHSAFSNALHILHCSAHHASLADWKALHLAMQNALTGHYALQILDVHRFFTHCVMKSKTRLLFPTLLWCAQFTNSSFSPLYCVHNSAFPRCTVMCTCAQLLFSSFSPLYLLLCAHLHKFLFRRQHAAHGNTDMASLTRSVSDWQVCGAPRLLGESQNCVHFLGLMRSILGP